MRQRVDKRRAQTLALASRFRTGRGLNGNGARNDDSGLGAYRRRHFVGELVGPPGNGPDRTHSNHQGPRRQIAGNGQSGSWGLDDGAEAGPNAHRHFRGGGIELVAFADVENNAVEREDALDQARKVADEPLGVFVEHEFLAKFVEPLDISLPLLGPVCLAAGQLSHPAHYQATGYEGEHVYPFLRVRQPKCPVRKQEEVIERECAKGRDIKRER